ncbi:MAG: EamA family transporter [Deltaproteobacteria bacterium]|nr:EamA family transporter [Deltaproteobacteria bacterium]
MSKIEKDIILGRTFAILSAMGYATGAVLARQGITGLTTPLAGSAVSLLTGALVLGVIAGRRLDGNLRKKKRSVFFFFLAGLASGSGALSSFFALSLAPVVVISPIQNTYPLFALLFARIFLSRLEKITFRLVVGALFVVGGVAMITLGKAG